jgi:hypothetical protein
MRLMVGKDRKVRKTKQFSLHEANGRSLDNFWWVSKGRKGFYLNGNEVGPNSLPSRFLDV